MRTSDKRVRLETSTLRLMLHLRALEKLGGDSREVMLFPAATLHNFERQKQEKKGEGDVEKQWASVYQPASKILHVLSELEVPRELPFPAGLRVEKGGEITQQKQGED